MSSVEEIEKEIEKLTPSELELFRCWFLEFDAEAWDRQIEADATAGKLNRLAEAALTAHARGESREM